MKLSKIEKFDYLRSRSTGPPYVAIFGLSLSNENYNVATTILRDRFGDTQSVINKHCGFYKYTYSLLRMTPQACKNYTTTLRDT